MKQIDLVIRNPSGLHARPAKIFSNIAKRFNSEIRLTYAAKEANAKSMISVLTLGVHNGKTVHLEIVGDDEEEAAAALETAVAEGLSEEFGTPLTSESLQTAEQGTPPAITAEHQLILRGIPAAPGIAIGKIFQLYRSEITVAESFTDPENEQTRLRAAIDHAREELRALREQVANLPENAADIFDVHLEMLEDPDLVGSTKTSIEAGQSAGRAWKASFEEIAARISEIGDTVIAARSADVKDVGNRILRILSGTKSDDVLREQERPVVIVADDLVPSDTISLDRSKVVGFCTSAGGPTSHAAILARSLGIPAVVNSGKQALELANGTQVIIDGTTGMLTIDPDHDSIADAHASARRSKETHAAAVRAAVQTATTQDGHRVAVCANIGSLTEVPRALAEGADGIGLLRTEWLFLDRTTPPSEEEQSFVLQDIVRMLDGRPLVVRTLDIGGDKPLPYIAIEHENNPFLGERGIRLSLAQPDLLRDQLRAIFRVAKADQMRVMFPMVSDRDELQAVCRIFEEVRQEVSAPAVEKGIMIEVPSAALMADVLAEEVDFFSIGTNDLTQYTLAADRLNPRVNGLSDAMHPAVLRLIDQTVRVAHNKEKHVALCGELGADLQAVPVLVGLGLDEISVSVPALADVKALVRELSWDTCREIAQQALQCATAAEVRKQTMVHMDGILNHGSHGASISPA